MSAQRTYDEYVANFRPQRSSPPLAIRIASPRDKIKEALTAIAARHGVTYDEMMGQRRHRTVVAARHEAIRYVHMHTMKSSVEIGRMFNRDHSSILHALGRLQFSPRILRARDKLRRRVHGSYSAFRAMPYLDFAVSNGALAQPIFNGPL